MFVKCELPRYNSHIFISKINMFMFTNWHLRIDGSHSKLTNLPTKKWAAILTDRVYEIFAFPVGEILPSSAIIYGP